tara:strand:- start:84 stop:803 length:720 start_codon:yes stop_codon:yes gene_type:complete
MGYKRTVRCSYCYERGHNKSSCPAYKEKIESYRVEFGDDHYLVRDWDAKKARKAAAVSNRKCSYCGEQGHNRAGCTKLKAAMAAFTARNAEYCENLYAALVENGIAPGAMIRERRWGDIYDVKMVVGINWDAAHMAGRNNDIVITRSVKRLAKNDSWNGETSLPKSVTGNDWGPDFEVLVPSSSKRLRATMPSTFLAGSVGVKKIFKDKSLGISTMNDGWGSWTNVFDPLAYSTKVAAS